MKKYILLLVLAAACQPNDPTAAYAYEKMKTQPGILIRNFRPTSPEKFDAYMSAVSDTLEKEEVYVFLCGEDIAEINPSFRETYFQSATGEMFLRAFDNDTTAAVENLYVGMGVFRDGSFFKWDETDEEVLGDRFYEQ